MAFLQRKFNLRIGRSIFINIIMDDNYTHRQDGIFYVPQNIPGNYSISDSESERILEDFSLQLTQHCKCQGRCNDTCYCIVQSGGPNYLESKNIPGITEFLIASKLKTGNISCPIFECNNFCLCSSDCGNRVVQRGPIEGLIIKQCDQSIKGLGLFTGKVINKGTFICEYAGEVISKCEALKRHKLYSTLNKMNYIICANEYCNGKVTQTIVDPSEFGNIGRYINHSCEPNCEIIPVRYDIPIPHLAIFSKKDIAANSEITFNYSCNHNSEEYIDKNVKRTKCVCGSEFCKKWLPFDSYEVINKGF